MGALGSFFYNLPLYTILTEPSWERWVLFLFAPLGVLFLFAPLYNTHRALLGALGSFFCLPLLGSFSICPTIQYSQGPLGSVGVLFLFTPRYNTHRALLGALGSFFCLLLVIILTGPSWECWGPFSVYPSIYYSQGPFGSIWVLFLFTPLYNTPGPSWSVGVLFLFTPRYNTHRALLGVLGSFFCLPLYILLTGPFWEHWGSFSVYPSI